MVKAFKALKNWQQQTILISVATLSTGLLLFISLWFFVQSSAFRSMINNYIVEVSGERIELSDEIRVVSLFPNLSLDLPNAKARLQNFTFGYERVRLDGLRATFSPAFVFSRGSRGQVVFALKGLAAIASSKTSSSETSEEPSSASAQIIVFLNELAEVNLLLTIEKLDYIDRNAESGNTHLVGKNVAFEANRSEIWLSIDELSDQQQTVTFDAELENLNWDKSSPETLNGKLTVDVSNQSNGKPTHFESDFTVNEYSLGLSSLKLENDFLQLHGKASVTPSGNVTLIEGDLDVRELDLENIRNDFSVETSQSKRFFSSEEFDFSVLDNHDIEIGLSFDAVRYNEQVILGGKATLTASNTEIALVSEELLLMGGETVLEAKLNNLDTSPSLRLKLNANDMQLQRLHLNKGEEAVLNSGLADALISLRGRGKSSSALAGSLRGYTTVGMADIEVKQLYASRFDKGVIKWAREKISQLTKKKEGTEEEKINVAQSLPIRCASFKSQINNGRLEFSNGMIIEMPENTIFSSGYIDLEKEEVGVLFDTRRETFFDWSTISLIKYFEIGGTLLDPNYSLNTFELAKQGVLSYAGVLYGPLPSIVYSLGEAGQMQFSQVECIREIS